MKAKQTVELSFVMQVAANVMHTKINTNTFGSILALFIFHSKSCIVYVHYVKAHYCLQVTTDMLLFASTSSQGVVHVVTMWRCADFSLNYSNIF